MDHLARMQALVAVVDHGGFSPAARALGRSKALVSKHVSELEDHLGVRLLNRTTRQLSVTEAGRIYYRSAVDILKRVADLETAIHDHHRGLRGLLRIAGPRTLGDTLISEVTMAFLKEHPELSAELVLDDRFVDVVEDGFDVAIRISELPDSSLIVRRLGPFRLLVCARPDVIEGRRLHRPADLSAHPCLVDRNTRWRQNWPFIVDGERITVPVSGPLVANSPHAVRAGALAGLGFAQLPHPLVADDIAAGRLVALFEDQEITSYAIHAVYPHRDHLPGKVRAYVDFLVAAFRIAGGGLATAGVP